MVWEGQGIRRPVRGERYAVTADDLHCVMVYTHGQPGGHNLLNGTGHVGGKFDFGVDGALARSDQLEDSFRDTQQFIRKIV